MIYPRYFQMGILLCHSAVMDCFHSISSNDFMKESKLLVPIVPTDFIARAYSIAAFVSSFGYYFHKSKISLSPQYQWV